MKQTKTDLIKLEHGIGDVLRRPVHLHIEYFFRNRYCLLAVLALMSVAIVKSDGKFLGLMRDAYNHGYGMIGAYLREEPVRTPLTVMIARIPGISSK